MADEGTAFRPSIMRISNRALISRMKEWGWKEVKVGSDFTTMKAPAGDKIDVRSAHQHIGNSAETLRQVPALMQMDWNTFISFDFRDDDREAVWFLSSMDPDERQEVSRQVFSRVDEILAAEKQEERQRQTAARDARRLKRKQERKTRMNPQRNSPTEVPKPTPPLTAVPAVVEEADRQTRQRIINVVFDYLVEKGDPMSIQRIAKANNLKPSSVGGACVRLLELEVVERVKHGVYRVKPENASQDVRVDIVARAELGEPVPRVSDIVIQTPVEANTTPVEASAPNPPKPVTSGVSFKYDESINDVLDLLFPQGFKAKHLPLIDAWRQATMALIKEIDRDGK